MHARVREQRGRCLGWCVTFVLRKTHRGTWHVARPIPPPVHACMHGGHTEVACKCDALQLRNQLSLKKDRFDPAQPPQPQTTTKNHENQPHGPLTPSPSAASLPLLAFRRLSREASNLRQTIIQYLRLLTKPVGWPLQRGLVRRFFFCCCRYSSLRDISAVLHVFFMV
jgi:hypothetical protein